MTKTMMAAVTLAMAASSLSAHAASPSDVGIGLVAGGLLGAVIGHSAAQAQQPAYVAQPQAYYPQQPAYYPQQPAPAQPAPVAGQPVYAQAPVYYPQPVYVAAPVYAAPMYYPYPRASVFFGGGWHRGGFGIGF